MGTNISIVYCISVKQMLINAFIYMLNNLSFFDIAIHYKEKVTIQKHLTLLIISNII